MSGFTGDFTVIPVVMVLVPAGWAATECHASKHPFRPGNLRNPGCRRSREMPGP